MLPAFEAPFSQAGSLTVTSQIAKMGLLLNYGDDLVKIIEVRNSNAHHYQNQTCTVLEEAR